MRRGEFPRDVLNRIRWTKDSSLDDAEIVILHRGAPENRRRIAGREILSLGHMFFHTAEATIPYHRVLEIWHLGRLMFKRPEKGSGEG